MMENSLRRNSRGLVPTPTCAGGSGAVQSRAQRCKSKPSVTLNELVRKDAHSITNTDRAASHHRCIHACRVLV